ncbi:MAG: flavodoxin family protein [bacterium]|nr:flavodoxin family protein [bacterium]
MKITILNGNQGKNTAFDKYCITLTRELEKNDHTVTVYDLKKMNIKSCTGCFGCWVKTPGECVLADDVREVLKSYVHSNLILLASPLAMGFTSSLLRSVQEKFIPLILPFTKIINHELHHPARYDSLPLMGLVYEKEADTDSEDLTILEDLHHRAAINAHSKLVLFKGIENPVLEVVHEINSI